MSTGGDGRRIGLIVLGASFVGHAGNYLYYVIAARMVSPPTFAAISALIAFGTIAMMPINGIQLAVARDVAVLRTSGTAGALSGYLRRLGRRMWVTCLGLFVLISAALRHPVIYALAYVAIWEQLIATLVGGAKYLSIEQWSLGIAHSVSNNSNLDSHLTFTPSIVLSVIAVALTTWYASERLSAFTVRAD